MENCNFCKKEFEPYLTYIECTQCDEGTIERDADFGEGYTYVSCGSCGGKGGYNMLEYDFCSEACSCSYFEDQIEY